MCEKYRKLERYGRKQEDQEQGHFDSFVFVGISNFLSVLLPMLTILQNRNIILRKLKIIVSVVSDISYTEEPIKMIPRL